MHPIPTMWCGSLLLFMCSLALFIASFGPSPRPPSHLSNPTSTANANPHVAWLCGVLGLIIIGLITFLFFHAQQACFRPSVSDLARRYEEIALREYSARNGQRPSKTKRAKIKEQARAKAFKDYDRGSVDYDCGSVDYDRDSVDYDDNSNNLSDISDNESDAAPSRTTNNAQAAARRTAAPNPFTANLRIGNITGMQFVPSLRWESVIGGIVNYLSPAKKPKLAGKEKEANGAVPPSSPAPHPPCRAANPTSAPPLSSPRGIPPRSPTPRARTPSKGNPARTPSKADASENRAGGGEAKFPVGKVHGVVFQNGKQVSLGLTTVPAGPKPKRADGISKSALEFITARIVEITGKSYNPFVADTLPHNLCWFYSLLVMMGLPQTLDNVKVLARAMILTAEAMLPLSDSARTDLLLKGHYGPTLVQTSSTVPRSEHAPTRKELWDFITNVKTLFNPGATSIPQGIEWPLATSIFMTLIGEFPNMPPLLFALVQYGGDRRPVLNCSMKALFPGTRNGDPITLPFYLFSGHFSAVLSRSYARDFDLKKNPSDWGITIFTNCKALSSEAATASIQSNRYATRGAPLARSDSYNFSRDGVQVLKEPAQGLPPTSPSTPLSRTATTAPPVANVESSVAPALEGSEPTGKAQAVVPSAPTAAPPPLPLAMDTTTSTSATGATLATGTASSAPATGATSVIGATAAGATTTGAPPSFTFVPFSALLTAARGGALGAPSSNTLALPAEAASAPTLSTPQRRATIRRGQPLPPLPPYKPPHASGIAPTNSLTGPPTSSQTAQAARATASGSAPPGVGGDPAALLH